MEMCTFFLFCLNIIFFSFSTALQRLEKLVTCFLEDKISKIYPDLQIQKVLNSNIYIYIYIRVHIYNIYI